MQAMQVKHRSKMMKSCALPRAGLARLPGMGLAAGIVLLLALAAGLYWRSGLLRGWLPAYRTEDVVYDRPLQATHTQPGPASASLESGAVADSPRMEILPAFHDFGTVGMQSRVRWTFPIFNHGSAPLVIARAYTTCGCTTAEFSASVVPPGKVSLVTVTFDPAVHGFPGATLRRGVIFETNDPAQAQGEVWIQAHLR